jgi:hypothetical protein
MYPDKAKAERGAVAIVLRFIAKQGPAAINASFLDKNGQQVTGRTTSVFAWH